MVPIMCNTIPNSEKSLTHLPSKKERRNITFPFLWPPVGDVAPFSLCPLATDTEERQLVSSALGKYAT